MSTNRTHGVFTVQFIRNGDTVTCYTEVLRAGGDHNGMNLVQFWEEGSGVTSATDWSPTHADRQPVIHLRMRSSNNYPIDVTSVTWAYKGSTLEFAGLNENTWVVNTDTAYAGLFMSKIDSNGIPCLRIANNLISATSLGNAQITFTVHYKTLGQTSDISGSLDVWLRLASSKAVQLFLYANRREISVVNPTATVTAVAYNGSEEMDLNNYTLKWFDADGLISGASSSSLVVTRDMIQGREMIRCEMYNNASDENYIAASAIDIWDIDDEYQIGHTPVADHNYCMKDHDAQYYVHVLKNGIEMSGVDISYVYRIFNCAGMITRDNVTALNALIVVTSEDCKVIFKDIEGEPLPEETTYGDATVEVTASWLTEG